MKYRKEYWQVIKANYQQLLFVCAAFVAMALVCCLYVAHIMRRQMDLYAESAIALSQNRMQNLIAQKQNALLDAATAVTEAVNQGAGNEELARLMTLWVANFTSQKNVGPSFLALYGQIDGTFVNGVGWDPGKDYLPPTQPWYSGAVAEHGEIHHTEPYADFRTGDIVGSMSITISDRDGKFRGVISIDFVMSAILTEVQTLKLAGGSGIFIDANYRLAAYPNQKLIGRDIRDIPGFMPVFDLLQNSDPAHRMVEFIDDRGVPSVGFFGNLINGWRLGIVSPLHNYYRDANRMIPIICALALVLMSVLCIFLIRLFLARDAADERNRSKNSFLARISHEIRTPLNAIVGMSELLMQSEHELSAKNRSYAKNIKQAGGNLLSIINDILDFSKMESGQLEIEPTPYLLASLVNDLVNIIRIRFREKSVQFFVQVDANIPALIVGDIVRIREILLNLLSNAAKYTHGGFVNFTVHALPPPDNQAGSGAFSLKFAVEDTGIGIKEEDLSRLFGDFVRIDHTVNMGIEGTGLGLTISKNLAQLMNGSINVSSQYGRGSTFTVVIPQLAGGPAPFARVEDTEKKRVLCFEDRHLFSLALGYIFEDLKVEHLQVASPDAFADSLASRTYTHIVLPGEKLALLRPHIDKSAKGAMVAILTDDTAAMTNDRNIQQLILPVYSLPLANFLNNMPELGGYEEQTAPSSARFVAPGARILVVDDFQTNLIVTEGLLLRYETKTDFAHSGQEAIDKVAAIDYDLVFMDHMMPGIDGMEATKRIRALPDEKYRKLPIIALTANAVLGMREMFLANGFDDFLPKPIETGKLNAMLAKWIPAAKQSRPLKPGSTVMRISEAIMREAGLIVGVDVAVGLERTGGHMEIYRRILDVFLRDGRKGTKAITDSLEKLNLKSYTVQVHAMKSACATVGAVELAEQAALLEAAGRGGNMAFVQEKTGIFLGNLQQTLESAAVYLGQETAPPLEKPGVAKTAPAAPGQDSPPWRDAGSERRSGAETRVAEAFAVGLPEGVIADFQALGRAFADTDTGAIDRLLARLEGEDLPAPVKAALGRIGECYLQVEYEEAEAKIGAIVRAAFEAGQWNEM